MEYRHNLVWRIAAQFQALDPPSLSPTRSRSRATISVTIFIVYASPIATTALSRTE